MHNFVAARFSLSPCCCFFSSSEAILCGVSVLRASVLRVVANIVLKYQWLYNSGGKLVYTFQQTVCNVIEHQASTFASNNKIYTFRAIRFFFAENCLYYLIRWCDMMMCWCWYWWWWWWWLRFLLYSNLRWFIVIGCTSVVDVFCRH